MKTITAIIPLFDGERWIAGCLASVQAQTVPPNEIIVVNDGSTDRGVEIAKRFGVRIIHKQNGGQSSARNSGVAATKDDLIAFLDQDDCWLPNHLQRPVGDRRCNRPRVDAGRPFGRSRQL